ncbi:MAG TPA: hypothetical protein VEK34_17090 [Methylocella sp.]|nr:hypothetical protein [Methylocella sp.]
MKTSIDHIRDKIAELEGRIAALRIAEHELAAAVGVPATVKRAKGSAKGKARANGGGSEPRQTVGGAITDVLDQHGALPLAELAEHIRSGGRDVSSGTLSNTLQTMKKRGAVKSGGGKWMLAKASRKRAEA